MYKIDKTSSGELIITLKPINHYNQSFGTHSVEILRDRFNLVLKINDILKQKEILENISRDSTENIKDVFEYQKIPEFIEPYEEIFAKLESNSTVFIHGESGCGKTTLANEFAHYAKQKDSNLLVQFIKSSSYKSNIEELARRILTSWETSSRPGDLLEQIFERIESRNVLIIIDNVKEANEIRDIPDYMNKTKHRLIVTTKCAKFTENWLGVKLGMFNKTMTIRYLENLNIVMSDEDRKAFETENFTEISPLLLKLGAKGFKGKIIR